jgi:hypothetical protein
VGILGAFVAVCLGPALVGARTLLSVNALTQQYPWIATNGIMSAGHELCTGDTFDSVLPGIAHARAQLFAGHLASWQNVVSGGGPLVSVPDLGLLDPLSLPYYVLPLWLAPAFVVLLSFIVAVGGTFLFLRRLNLSRPASMLAGLVFATSGFMVMWTNWPQTRVAALIPALFWATERLIQRMKLADVVLVAVVVASMIFGGFPVVTGYGIYLVAGYFVVRVFLLHHTDLRAWGRAVGLAVVGLGLGVALTMVQLLPFAYFYRYSNFAYRTGEAKVGLPFSGLVTLFAPNTNGLCIGGAAPDTGTVNPIELVAFVGAAALVLAVCGAAYGVRRRQSTNAGVRGYFVAAVVAIVLLGWGATFFRDITIHLPAFAGNFIGRIRSVLGFALAALVAIGFDWVTSRGTPGSEWSRRVRLRRGWWAIGVWGVVIAVGLVVLLQLHHTAVVGKYWVDVKHALWVPLVFVAAALAVVVASRVFPRHGPKIAFVVLPLLVAAQSAQFFHAVLPGDSRSNFYAETGAHRFLAAHLGNNRFSSSDGTMYPSTGLYYGLRTPTGHFFTEPAWADLLTAVDPNVMRTPTYSDFTGLVNQTNVGDEPILDQMGVTYFVLGPDQLAGRQQPLPPTNGSVALTTGSLSCTVPGQPLRGVTVDLVTAPVPASSTRGMTVYVTVRDGSRTISSGRFMPTGLPAGTPLPIAVAGESLPRGGTITVLVSARGARGAVNLAADDGRLACGAVQPIDDHLRVVYADPGSIIYQRLTALPRIRWATQAVVVPAATTRVTDLEHGIPADEVLLDAPGPSNGTSSATGQTGTTPSRSVPSGRVTVLTDDDDSISARVESPSAGYLVVADALQQKGWSVTVDGHAEPLLPADDAMVAVAVPAGTHIIEVSYKAPGQRTGFVISVLALLILGAITGREAYRRRRARRPRHVAPTPPPPPSPPPDESVAVDASPSGVPTGSPHGGPD